MRIQTVSALRLVLYIEQGDLLRRGLRRDGLGLREVLLLTREACEEVGIPQSRLAEIEAFPQEDGALIFVRMERRETEWFRFHDLPAALDGVTAMNRPAEGALAWHDGSYWLSSASEGMSLLLSELGHSATEAEAEEVEAHGSLVLDAPALERLRQCLRK